MNATIPTAISSLGLVILVWIGTLILQVKVMRPARIMSDRFAATLSNLQITFDAVSDGIALLDDQRRLIACNTHFTSMLGPPFDSIRIGDVIPSFQPEDPGAVKTQLGHVRSVQFYNMRQRWLEARERTQERAGHLVTAVVVTDVTEMAAARQAAEDANRTKSTFLASMSHEIRTPMNAILGLSYLLSRSNLDGKQREQLAKISVAAEHLLSIINDILDISKIEAGKLLLEETEFDVDAMMQELQTLISERAHAKKLELVFNFHHLPAGLYGDPTRIKQLLLNYLSNAVKFTETGSIILTGSVLDENPDGLMIRFEVKDSGIGIAPEQLKRLFQPFEQADRSTTRRYGGTGLGLVINRRLAQMMGGDAGADSEPGHGSSFWFTVRLKPAVSPKKARRSQSLKSKRALVVDDQSVARIVIGEILGQFGMEVTLAEGGRQATSLIQSADENGTPFDVVIIDWRMPEMDGIEVAANLRQMALGALPHLILITAYDDSMIRDRAVQVGYQSVLVKPVTPSSLNDALGALYGD